MKAVFPQNNDLYAITDFALSCGRSNVQVVQELLAAGVRLIQYREKDRKMGVMLEECRAIREMTKAAGAIFIVNDHIDLALLVKADGVHVGQDDLPVPAVRELVGADMLIGLSTHSPEQARNAVAAGADYIGVGPIYATKTKKDVCEPVGLEYLEYVATKLNIPFTAIGGIKVENVKDVLARGAKNIAIISAIVNQPDIAVAVHAFKTQMQAG